MKRKPKKTSFWKAQRENKTSRFILKLLLSLFILYHLSMIFIMPNINSLAHEQLNPYFTFYASTLSLNNAWDFYAPNPAYYYYFEVEVIDSKDQVDTFRWPEKRKESLLIYLNYNRLIYHARFFIITGPQSIRRYLIPYFCRRYPTANEVTLKIMIENRPHFKKAKTFRQDFFSAQNKENMKTWSTIHAKCKKRKKSRKTASHLSYWDDPL